MPKSTQGNHPTDDVLEVGIKALRADISRWIDESRRHDVVITDRGRPVARLVPIGQPPGLQRLIERDLVRMPTTRAARLTASSLVRARGSVAELVDEQRR
jgi:prevent-host-death family protein